MASLYNRSNLFLLFTLSVLLSLIVTPKVFAQVEPGQRCFTITGYYSAFPPGEQRIYSNGGTDDEAYQKELHLNGQGLRMANGQPPYVGAVAAPKTYPFGAQIRLDGIGIFVVGDRGGAIVPEGERGYSCDRIDIYTGSGESGLAMALHLGKRTVQGEIYTPGGAPEPWVDLSWLSTQLPPRLLSLIDQTPESTKLPPIPYTVAKPAAPVNPETIQDARSVEEKLIQLGYEVGSLTQAILQFQLDHGVIDHPESYGAGHYGPKTSAALTLALQSSVVPESEIQPGPLPESEEVVPENHWLVEEKRRLSPGLYLGDAGEGVKSLQVALSQLDLYNQSITGEYDEATKVAVLEFQKMNGVVASQNDYGAGVFGPKTHAAMEVSLEERIEKWAQYPQEAQGWVPAKQVLPRLNELTLPEPPDHPVALNFGVSLQPFMQSPLSPYRHLKKGARGSEVVALQELLIKEGVLATGLNTGYYGELTEKAVKNYELKIKT